MSRDERDRKKVPSWDGSPETYDTYEIKVGIFLRTGARWKEPELIAELVSKLEGKAWSLIEQISEEERDKLNSREVFLNFLKKNLLEAAVPELGKLFKRWQVFKRQGKESMKLYVMRHRKVLSRLEKALSQVDDGKELTRKLKVEITEHCHKVLQQWPKRVSKPASVKSHDSKTSRTSQTSANPEPKVWKSRKARQGEEGQEEESVLGTLDGDDDDEEKGLEPGARPETAWGWRKQSWWDSGWHEWKEPEMPKTSLEKLGEHLGAVNASIITDPEATQHLNETITLIGAAWRESALPALLTGWHLLQ